MKTKFFKAFLIGMAMVAGTVFASISTDQIYQLNHAAGPLFKVQLGTLLQHADGGSSTFAEEITNKKVATVVYDYAADGGSSTAAINLGALLPSGAVVTKCYFDVITAITAVGNVSGSGSGSTQLSFGVNTAADLKAALDVSTLSGRNDCIPTGLAANMVKLTADRQVVMTLTKGNTSAGKVALFVEYVLSQ